MIAIVVVAYNRVTSVKNLLNSLDRAYYSCEVPLIISIDKSDTDAVCNLADSFIWKYGPKKIIKHEQNLGLRKHILSIGEYTKEYDAIIVLEDDLTVSPSFYNYAIEAVAKYKDNDKIAGISLYSFPLNHQTYLPFVPEKNEYDAFMFQNAQSWGQIWMRRQWSEFQQWYSNHSEEFGQQPHLPFTICNWGKNSWLKYHIRYCIEMNKFFVYPYVSLTFCTGAAGVHSRITNNNTHCVIQQGNMSNYRFPEIEQAVKYDAFFERIGLEQYVNVNDLCIDINGTKGNKLNNRYWLTSELYPYKRIKSYGLLLLPIEQNVINNISGNAIFLYDTTQADVKPQNNGFNLLNYYYKFSGIFRFMKCRGWLKISFLIIKYIISKIK